MVSTIDQSNCFTSVSTKGSAVVDYIAVSQDYIDKCTSCEVLPVNDLLEQYNLYGLIGEKCKPPDHSIISLTPQTLVSMTGNVSGINFEYVDKPSLSKKRYYLNDIPHDFFIFRAMEYCCK